MTAGSAAIPAGSRAQGKSTLTNAEGRHSEPLTSRTVSAVNIPATSGPRCSARLAFELARSVIAFWLHQLHNDAMSTSITVRDVPDQTRDELASRAALTGRSLQEYLRAKLMELARQPDAEALIARVRARKAASAPSLPRDRILAYRDEDRR